jgi:hypothetical protein
MSLLISGDLRLSRTQLIPAVIGEPWGGGYFAGYISHTADGNPTHALIVAPRSATGASWDGVHADHKPSSGRPPTPPLLARLVTSTARLTPLQWSPQA